MSEKQLTEMSYSEFQEVMDTYIIRSARQDDAIPSPTFLELLFDTLSKRVKNVIQLQGQVVNGELVLAAPTGPKAVQVRGNQILLGDWRVIVKLQGGEFQPA